MGAAESSSKLAGSVHDFTVKYETSEEEDSKHPNTWVSFRVLLFEISNFLASLCTMQGAMIWSLADTRESGLTNSNYAELGLLHQKYGSYILAFPCNQFAGQEPGSNEQIMEFACTRFKAEYPIFGKVNVNGSNAVPLYKFLRSEKGGIFGASIKWNFAKFLVDKDGHVVSRYAPTSSPLNIENDIKKLLEA